MGDSDETSPHHEALAAIVQDLRVEEQLLGERMADCIEAEVTYFRSGAVDRADLVETTSGVLRAALDAFGQKTAVAAFDSSGATLTGLRWARMGVPLVAVLSASRISSRFTWQTVVAVAERRQAPPELLVTVASALFHMQDLTVEAVIESYRSESTAIRVSQEAERSALVEALVNGQAMPTVTLWEIAELLQLPHDGHFTVVVAELQRTARGVLGDVERHLHSAGFRSVWRLLPDVQVGIVSLPGGGQDIRGLLRVLRANSTARQGVSPVYDDLAATAGANRLARSALLGSIGGAEHVVMFDDAPLLMTSVAAPEINLRIARSVLAGLDPLSPEQRTLLLDTLSGWFDCAGSAALTAERLYLHRNTVRQRLNRLEQLTDRSLTNPRHVAELCIALESERHLPGGVLPAL